ncbi:CMRF35-like molecule 9 isoform X9 [Artibeus jamaicensis]|uniref:CMRF35-like molecule 9 isoform X9 n=1 Tax=Artibeus jamaicensis TaxID=9417 RepID=UPI00235B26DB|nr:CMRF35-like molecule 9 isoform X9 [Artibeus jamaicensis]
MRPLVLLCSCLLLPGCGALTGLKNIRGSEGDTVSILCTYGEKLRNHQKYWCRKAGILFERCSGTIYARADGRENTEGRVSIQDSPRELRFNVTLRALTLEDSGEYWCGIQMLGFDRSLLVSLVVLPGTSGPSTHLDSASAKDASLLPSSSSSKSRVCPATVRALAPALVLLALLLVSGLCALGRYILQWRKKVQLATETQRNEKVHHSHLPLGKGQVPEFSVIHMVEATAGPAASPCTDIQCPDQTSEQEEAPVQAPNGDALPGPPLHMSEELRRSVFVSV